LQTNGWQKLCGIMTENSWQNTHIFPQCTRNLFKLTPEHLSFLDRNLEPVVEPGMFKVMAGSSSEDIRLKGEFEVKR